MNDYQLKLYNDLMTLASESEAFYFADFEKDGSHYRIFNYRLASYTEFLKPGALECRGVMFEVEGHNAKPLRLAALPMEKFFNLNENPMTMNLDLSTIADVELKADGSLMSTYLHYNPSPVLRLKSKGSISSDQCLAAMKWLARPENDELNDALYDWTLQGFTVNLEWCSPVHRIVIGYEEPHLQVLNIRNNDDGEYYEHDQLGEDAISKYWTDRHAVWPAFVSLEDFVESIPEMQSIEGFVIRLESGQRIKIKTNWYLALHHTKDSINSPRRLFEAVLEEATDDMKSLFYDDPVAIKMILDMEKFVEEKYNHMVDVVERFYEANKHLDRKDYAILGQNELDRMYFGLAMNKYSGKEFSYKDFLKKKWKDLGLKDNSDDEDEEPPRPRKPSKKDVRKFILGD